MVVPTCGFVFVGRVSFSSFLCLSVPSHPTCPSTSLPSPSSHDPPRTVPTRASPTSWNAPVHHHWWQPSLPFLLGRVSRPLLSNGRVSRRDRPHVPSTCSHASIRRVEMRRARGDGAQRRRRRRRRGGFEAVPNPTDPKTKKRRKNTIHQGIKK